MSCQKDGMESKRVVEQEVSSDVDSDTEQSDEEFAGLDEVGPASLASVAPRIPDALWSSSSIWTTSSSRSQPLEQLQLPKFSVETASSTQTSLAQAISPMPATSTLRCTSTIASTEAKSQSLPSSLSSTAVPTVTPTSSTSSQAPTVPSSTLPLLMKCQESPDVLFAFNTRGSQLYLGTAAQHGLGQLLALRSQAAKSIDPSLVQTRPSCSTGSLPLSASATQLWPQAQIHSPSASQ